MVYKYLFAHYCFGFQKFEFTKQLILWNGYKRDFLFRPDFIRIFVIPNVPPDFDSKKNLYLLQLQYEEICTLKVSVTDLTDFLLSIKYLSILSYNV